MQLVKYSSSTCQPCKLLKNLLGELDHDLVKNMVEVEVDTCKDEGLLQKARDLGIRRVPVMVILDDAGEVVKRQDGILTREALKEFLK